MRRTWIIHFHGGLLCKIQYSFICFKLLWYFFNMFGTWQSQTWGPSMCSNREMHWVAEHIWVGYSPFLISLAYKIIRSSVYWHSSLLLLLWMSISAFIFFRSMGRNGNWTGRIQVESPPITFTTGTVEDGYMLSLLL